MTKTRATLAIVRVADYYSKERDDRDVFDQLRKAGEENIFQVTKRVLWMRRHRWHHYVIRLAEEDDYKPHSIVKQAYPCKKGAPLSFQFDGEWYSLKGAKGDRTKKQ